MCNSVGCEFAFQRSKMLYHQRCQVAIFAEGEQVLLVKGVEVGLSVFIDDAIGNNNRSTFVGRTDTVERETARKTSDRSEETFKGLGEVMRDIILVYLDHRPPGPLFILQLRLPTYPNYAGVIGRRSNQSVQRFRCNCL